MRGARRAAALIAHFFFQSNFGKLTAELEERGGRGSNEEIRAEEMSEDGDGKREEGAREMAAFTLSSESQCGIGISTGPLQMSLPDVVAAAAVSIILLCYTMRRKKNSQQHRDFTGKVEAKLEFINRNKRYYGYPDSKKGFIDTWRERELPSLLPPLKILDHQQHQPNEEAEVYLDYAGSALPTCSQLSRIYQQCITDTTTFKDKDNFIEEKCSTQILANPHSLGGGTASDRTWKLMQQSIHSVMQHFGVDDEDVGMDNILESNDENDCLNPGYRLVFTSGATESLRLVAEHFPWRSFNISSPNDHGMLLNANSNLLLSDESIGNRLNQPIPPKLVKSFKVNSILVYPRNSHTSVIGMRNLAMSRCAQFHCAAVDDLRSASTAWFQKLSEQNAEYEENAVIGMSYEEKKQPDTSQYNETIVATATKTIWVYNLLVLPVECNFGGDRFDWSSTVAAARDSTYERFITFKPNHSDSDVNTIRICHKWYILLDTAKAAATSEVNLATIVPGGPDFAVASFYKMFGIPTGLGALFIKNQQYRKAKDQCNNVNNTDNDLDTMMDGQSNARHYFGGGSVDIVLPHVDFTVPRNSRKPSVERPASIESKYFVDGSIDFGQLKHGTQHFRGIVELAQGFQELSDLGGMSKISLHSTCLAAELVRRFNRLYHDNGKSVVCIYGQWKTLTFKEDIEAMSIGPTVAFNICDMDGSIIGYDEVSRLAALNRPSIQLRTGCFCNPGACQDALMSSDEELIENWRNGGHVCGDQRGIVNGRPTGCIRASFGKDNIWEDMDALASFIENVFVSRKTSLCSKESYKKSSTASQFLIDSIFIFPIKSCAAMQVQKWPIECNSGRLLFDREFALVYTSGVAMRLSTYPKMSQIQPIIDMGTNTMTISAPGHSNLILSLEKFESSSISSKEVDICGVLCTGSSWGGREASNWFTSVLGVRCWLARHDTIANTKLPSNQGQTSYSNEAPLLLVSMQSINVLNSIIRAQGWGKQVDSRHFRPNIVVGTKDPNSRMKDYNNSNPEDSWERITITAEKYGVELVANGKCARCQMVDIDPTSGMKGNTLRALAQYRRDRGRIYFGTFFSGIQKNESAVVWLEVGNKIQSVK